MHSPRQLLRLAQEFYNEREQTGQGDNGEQSAGREQAKPRNDQPAREEKKHERDRNETAAKVVENFPPRQRRDRIADAASLRYGNTRQQPLQKLSFSLQHAMP